MTHASRIERRSGESKGAEIDYLTTGVREKENYFLLVLRIGKQNIR